MIKIIAVLSILILVVGPLIVVIQVNKRNKLDSLDNGDPEKTQIPHSFNTELPLPQKLDVTELTKKALDERITTRIKLINEKIVNAAQRGETEIKFIEPRGQYVDYTIDYYSKRGYSVDVTEDCGTIVVRIGWKEWITDVEIEQEVKTTEASDLDKYYNY